jgi:hypothetical protein
MNSRQNNQLINDIIGKYEIKNIKCVH